MVGNHCHRTQKKEPKRNEDSLRDRWDNTKMHHHLNYRGPREGEERERT